jgi:V-type H+-transporting ATPase subunit D
MSSSLEQRTPSNVSTRAIRAVYPNPGTDINSELDELDREEFYRLKKVSNKKQRDQAAADKEIIAQREKDKQNGVKEDEGAETIDVLGEREDDDVIF